MGMCFIQPIKQQHNYKYGTCINNNMSVIIQFRLLEHSSVRLTRAVAVAETETGAEVLGRETGRDVTRPAGRGRGRGRAAGGRGGEGVYISSDTSRTLAGPLQSVRAVVTRPRPLRPTYRQHVSSLRA